MTEAVLVETHGSQSDQTASKDSGRHSPHNSGMAPKAIRKAPAILTNDARPNTTKSATPDSDYKGPLDLWSKSDEEDTVVSREQNERRTTPMPEHGRDEDETRRTSFVRSQRDHREGRVGLLVEGRYRIIDKLGEGGMGTVFVAEQIALGRLVALKIIRKEFNDDGEVAARFAREAMVGGQLDHPNVASTLDYGTLPDGSAFIAMQYAKGSSVHQILAERKGSGLEWVDACDVCAQVADALHTAHQAGVVHRDLKPENILLEDRETGYLAKVLDFGMARITMTESEAAEDQSVEENTDANFTTGAVTELTHRGTIMGTLGYMAPEQAAGNPVDQKADLYALGVILWEMIVGRPLFLAKSRIETLASQLLRTPEPLKEAAAGKEVPDELCNLVTRLLERDPKLRTITAAEARDSLREIAGIATVGAASIRPSGPSQASRSSAPDPLAKALAPRSGTKLVWFGLMAGAIGAAALAASQFLLS